MITSTASIPAAVGRPDEKTTDQSREYRYRYHLIGYRSWQTALIGRYANPPPPDVHGDMPIPRALQGGVGDRLPKQAPIHQLREYEAS